MRLKPAQTAQALAIAASCASGVKANFGTMTKPLHVGHTARDGLFAAMLAAEGFTANPGALEHKQGFLMVFNGEGNFDAAKMLEGWGEPYDIVKPGIGIKQHPCCGSTHPAVDAMLALREKHKPQIGRVARIDSWTHPRRLAHTDRPDPAIGARRQVQRAVLRRPRADRRADRARGLRERQLGRRDHPRRHAPDPRRAAPLDGRGRCRIPRRRGQGHL